MPSIVLIQAACLATTILFVQPTIASIDLFSFFTRNTTTPSSTRRPPIVDGGDAQLLCYTCMSKNIPSISKDILRKTVNIPETVQTESCNDPFDKEPSMVESCDSACLKVVSENRYLRIVLRGCLTSIYRQLPMLKDRVNDYVDQQNDMGSCDEIRQASDSIGDIVTETCLCTTSFCNGAQRPRIAATAFTTLFSITAVHLLLLTLRR